MHFSVYLQVRCTVRSRDENFMPSGPPCESEIYIAGLIVCILKKVTKNFFFFLFFVTALFSRYLRLPDAQKFAKIQKMIQAFKS